MSLPTFRDAASTHRAREEKRLSMSDFGLLSDIEKQQLCEELLAEFGATVVRVTSDGEMQHSCCLPFGHADKSPSASLNYKELKYNCLAAETVVKTFEGDFPIEELAGRSHLLIDGDGNWVESEVRSFGVQKLRRITLSRNGVRKVVHATPEHRWLRQTKGTYADSRKGVLVELTTDELRPGHRLPSVWSNPVEGLAVSPLGVARGFVYGDGTTVGGKSRAYFCGAKDDALIPFFAPAILRYDTRGVGRISGLPRYWKTDLPEVDEGSDYLMGWMAGYLAADGHVDRRGFPSIASSKRESLEHVRLICDRLGIKTLGIYEQMRMGYGTEPSAIYQLRFGRDSLPEDFFIIPEHRQRYRGRSSSWTRTNWVVVGVEETERVEEVFCAVVPTTHSFVLEDGLLTRNCFACGGGSLIWFIGVCRNGDSETARRWLVQHTGINTERSLEDLLRYFDSVWNAKEDRPPPIPHLNDRIIEPWMLVHPYLTDPITEGGRGIPLATVEHFKVGWNPDTDRIVMPHWWKGQLVGWQTRRLANDGSEKYKNSPDFPKDRTIYNYNPRNRNAIAVESVMSVLSKYHLTPEICSTFGAEVNEVQQRLLGRHDRVTLFFDNDKAGWRATHAVGEALMAYCSVYAVQSPWAADPADLDDATYKELVDAAVPYSLWTPPTTLREWRPS